MNKWFAITLLFTVSACAEEATRSASYTESDRAVSVTLELFHMHPYLAEYERELVLFMNGKEITRQKLFPDTGGYSSTNLYRCSPNQYLAKGYFDSWVIDLKEKSIYEGECKKKEKEFVGAFHGAGSYPWQFYQASERKEEQLVAKGG